MIRRATEGDVEAIVAIFESSFATLEFLPQLHTHEEHLAFFGRCVREGEAYVLGEGFAVLAGDTLTHMYVHADAIGTGVGHALFEHVKTVRPDGFDFWVFQQNERARRFHVEHGAVPVEVHRRLRHRGTGAGRQVRVAAACSCRIARAMTMRWISLVPS